MIPSSSSSSSTTTTTTTSILLPPLVYRTERQNWERVSRRNWSRTATRRRRRRSLTSERQFLVSFSIRLAVGTILLGWTDSSNSPSFSHEQHKSVLAFQSFNSQPRYRHPNDDVTARIRRRATVRSSTSPLSPIHRPSASTFSPPALKATIPTAPLTSTPTTTRKRGRGQIHGTYGAHVPSEGFPSSASTVSSPSTTSSPFFRLYATGLGDGDYGGSIEDDVNLTIVSKYEYQSELSISSTSVIFVEGNNETTATIMNPIGRDGNNIVDVAPVDATNEDNNFEGVLATTAAATAAASTNSTTATPRQGGGRGRQNQKYHWTSQHFELAIPALIGMLADPLLSLMDTAYVGRVGPTELAALGACTSIFHLAFNAFRATTTATTSLVGNATPVADSKTPDSGVGSVDRDDGDVNDQRPQIVQISLSLGVVLGLVVLYVLRSAGPWALQTMGVPTTSALFVPAMAYLSARLWAAPVVLFIVVAEGAFRGYSDTKIPLVASLVAAAINFVLDPLLMFSPGDKSGIPGLFGWGTRGAAAATAISQLGAAVVYLVVLIRRQMLPRYQFRRLSMPSSWFTRNRNIKAANQSNLPASAQQSARNTSKMTIIKTILGANLAMVMKQGSLLLAWAYATARATRIGHAHVAAHQVALSCWLVFALILDGAAVSAQVLMTRSLASGSLARVWSLVMFMTRFSVVQGLATTGAILLAAPYLPGLFTPDAAIRGHLASLMPQLAWQQLLVSLTLVMEALAIGGNQFQLLAAGTTISTIFSMGQLKQATTVVDIWSKGIVSLFVGRFITALVGIARVIQIQRRNVKDSETSELSK